MNDYRISIEKYPCYSSPNRFSATVYLDYGDIIDSRAIIYAETEEMARKLAREHIATRHMLERLPEPIHASQQSV